MASVIKSLQLDSDHFNFDLTEGFEMAVEKDWNVLDVVDINDTLPIYDSDLRRHMPGKYAIRLFFKACVPMCYVDGETYETNPLLKDADNASYTGKYFSLEEGTPIGSPVIKQSQGSSMEQSSHQFGYHGLLIADGIPSSKEAYALPEYRQLNHTNITMHDFATGCTIATPNVGGLGNGNYYQPVSIDALTENVQNFTFELMTPAGFNAGGVVSFIVNNGALAYTVSTEGNRLNVPTDDDNNANYKYLQPALFKPFGVGFKDHVGTNETVGWFYCVLGVNEISEEDPDWQVDPSIVRLSSTNLQIDPVEGTYTYDGDLGANSGTLSVEVADYAEISEITINDTVIVVPSPSANVYAIPFTDQIVTEGDNIVIIKTIDINHQELTYTFTLAYEAPAALSPLVSITDQSGLDEFSDITGVAGTTSYTSTYDKTPSVSKYQWGIEVADGYTITSAKQFTPSDVSSYTGLTPADLPDADWHNLAVGDPVSNVYSFQNAGSNTFKWFKFVISDGTTDTTYYVAMEYNGPQYISNLEISSSTSATEYIFTTSDQTSYSRTTSLADIASILISVNGDYRLQAYDWSVTDLKINGVAQTIPTKSNGQYSCTISPEVTLITGDNTVTITVTNGTTPKTYTITLTVS